MKIRILSIILSLAMMISVLSGVIGTIETEASGLDENNYCADISEYRTGNKEEGTYPT